MKTKQKKPQLVYFLLGGVIIIFLGLLFFSTMDSSITTEIEFKDSINISNVEGNYIVGTLNIENTGFLPQRVILPNYLACTQDKQRIDLNYLNSNYQNDITGMSKQYIDVSGKSSEKIHLTTYYHMFEPKRENQTQSENIEIVYVFKSDNNQRYNYQECLNKEFSDAITSITLEQWEEIKHN